MNNFDMMGLTTLKTNKQLGGVYAAVDALSGRKCASGNGRSKCLLPGSAMIIHKLRLNCSFSSCVYNQWNGTELRDKLRSIFHYNTTGYRSRMSESGWMGEELWMGQPVVGDLTSKSCRAAFRAWCGVRSWQLKIYIPYLVGCFLYGAELSGDMVALLAHISQ